MKCFYDLAVCDCSGDARITSPSTPTIYAVSVL